MQNDASVQDRTVPGATTVVLFSLVLGLVACFLLL
jgi:hypothetical protein